MHTPGSLARTYSLPLVLHVHKYAGMQQNVACFSLALDPAHVTLREGCVRARTSHGYSRRCIDIARCKDELPRIPLMRSW